MSDLKQCHDLLASSKRVVRLAFELAGDEAERIPERLAKVLASKPVQDAIQEALHAEATALLKEQLEGKPGDPDAAAFVKRVGEKVGTPVGKEYLKAVEDSPAFRQLKDAGQKVLDDFNCTPTGAFVNANKTALIITGVVLVVGGVVGLYAARTGDFLMKPLSGAEKEVKLGKLTLGVKLAQLEPSKRAGKIDLTIAPPGPFKGTIQGATEEGKFAVGSDGTLALPLGRGFSVDFGYHLSLSAIPLAPNARALVLQGPGETTIDYRLFAKARFIPGKSADHGFSFDAVAAVQNHVPMLSLGAAYRTTDPHLKFSASAGLDLQPRGASARGTVGLNGMWGDYPWRFDATGRFGTLPGPTQGAQLTPQPDVSVLGQFTLFFGIPPRSR